MDATSITCPFCGSEEVSKPQTSKQALAISILLLGFPVPFMKKVYYCYNCGEYFKKK